MYAVEKYINPWQTTVSSLSHYHHEPHTKHSPAVLRPVRNSSLHELLQSITKHALSISSGVFPDCCTRFSPGNAWSTTTQIQHKQLLYVPHTSFCVHDLCSGLLSARARPNPQEETHVDADVAYVFPAFILTSTTLYPIPRIHIPRTRASTLTTYPKPSQQTRVLFLYR